MDHLWIWAAVAAALFQALRYAALKELNKHLPAMVTGYVRLIFALPLLIAYLAVVLTVKGVPLPAMNARFLLMAALGSLGQFLATVLMVRIFQLGNFAVGTMLAKTDAIMTALIGTALFSEIIGGAGWMAILVTVAGVLTVSAARMPALNAASRSGPLRTLLAAMLLSPATQLGLLVALINAVSFLLLKDAIKTLASPGGPAVDAAAAGAVMTLMSCVMIGVWLAATDRKGLAAIGRHLGLCTFAGLASALGTLLWFLATALTNASYVAAVAQIQIVFALALSRFWFRESILWLELAGIAVILAGILLFRLT